MMTLWPLTLEISFTFFLASLLLYRYGNWTDQNAAVTISVFIAWFFSFIVIFILPLDISSTVYRQCITQVNETIITSTTLSPLPTSTTNHPFNHSDSTLFLTESFSNSTTISNHTSNDSLIDTCGHPWSYAQKSSLISLWALVYWSIQLLTWIILPLMQSYSMSGEFTSLGKLRSAFIENAIYYGSFAIIFFFVLIYVAIKSHLGWSQLRVICTTASNSWGLFLLVVLMGYGLVELPRSCFNTSLHGRQLTYLYFKVAKMSAEKIEADEKLDDVLDEINCAFQSISPNNVRFRQYINEILSKCPADWRNNLLSRYQNIDRGQQTRGGIAYTEKSLIRINKDIKKAVQTSHRVHNQWEHLILKAIDWEDVSRNQMNHSRTFKPTIKRKLAESSLVRLIFKTIYSPRIEWYWKCLIRGPFFRCLAYITAIISVIIIWSEMTFSITNPPLSVFSLILHNFQEKQSYFLIELFSIMSIAYLCTCTYYTVFKIRIFNYFFLAKNHQTDEYSLIFSGMLFCRLTPPLCLNFLGLTNLDSYTTGMAEKTAFTSVMGHFNDVPTIFENVFYIYLPIVMCLFCIATVLQFGSHLLHFMGIEQFILDDETTSELIKEGQDLVKREKNKKCRLAESEIPRELKSQAVSSRTSPTSNFAREETNENFRQQLPRFDKRDISRTELLDDMEPIDYTTLTPSARDYQSFDTRRPPSNIFDDI